VPLVVDEQQSMHFGKTFIGQQQGVGYGGKKECERALTTRNTVRVPEQHRRVWNGGLCYN